MDKILHTFESSPIQKFLDGKSSWTGQILKVDLSSRQMRVDRLGEDFYRRYLGGRGVILYYLLNETPSGIDAFAVENLLIFAPGILTGTVLPGSGRHAVGAKSPLTGALASGEAGGFWGAELKRAGYDAIVISGKSETPVYLWIYDGKVEICDASHLWGKLTADAQDIIRAELGDKNIRTALIGPAGENLVRFASVMHDVNRAAGRSGLGAVMGSKNLKAVAVRGSMNVGLADKAALDETLKWILGGYKTMMGWAVKYGTPGSVRYNHDSGGTAINNYRDAALEGIEQLEAKNYFPKFVTARDTCYRCPVRCKTVVNYQDERTTIEGKYGGPEYETFAALGPLCRVNDPVAVAKANELCAAYGLDTISAGGTIAFAMECAERGFLHGFDFVPQFGNGGSLIESVVRIAKREGIGNWMAEGSARMAQKVGRDAAEMLAVAKGQELPLHDPRMKNATALGYALSPTGADHMHNLLDNFANFPGSDVTNRLKEMGIDAPLPLFGLSDEKIKAYMYEVAVKHVFDSAVICQFYPYEYRHLCAALSAAGGWEVSVQEVHQIGQRIANIAQKYLVREGFTIQDDTLSARAFYRLKDGPIAGRGLTPQELKQGVQRYFELMGWDVQGAPSVDVS